MKRVCKGLPGLALWVCLAQACSQFEPSLPAGEEVLDGPVVGLTAAEAFRHAQGDAAFTGQVFTSLTGLGPIFVANSCGSCHAGDGKGHPFTTLTRFGQTDNTGNHFLDRGGPQLQNRALPGFLPEQIPAGATYTKLMPPGNTGLGFLELVPDSVILAMADPNDSDQDGISGVPNYNYLPSYIIPFSNAIPLGQKYICRFGKKAGAYSLLHQTVNAYNQDIGITSVFEPKDTYSGLLVDPEISTQTVNDVVFYLQTLKVPVQRNQNDPTIQQGKQGFLAIGCGNCHRPSLTAGYSPVDALSRKEFGPYTDLLLHDMGPGLDDGYTEGSAETYEWRTPPLWGLGLAPKSQGGQYFLLHDGRATSIEGAIQFHGGEAAASKANFNGLSQSEKDALIKFLKSL
jgi:CxxC motif-containing protein (DUF1111 family)